MIRVEADGRAESTLPRTVQSLVLVSLYGVMPSDSLRPDSDGPGAANPSGPNFDQKNCYFQHPTSIKSSETLDLHHVR